jgi:putative phosphoribosyl transferase
MSEHTVKIPPVGIYGDLMLPARAHAVILFADGSGRSRRNPANRHVAGMLQDRGLGTLLVDLLTEAEEEVDNRYDIALLAKRLGEATDWLQRYSPIQGLRVGYFGSGGAAEAALVAAAERRTTVGAIVARGGRPDLVGTSLRHLKAPTLLIVGGEDKQLVEVNRKALYQMQCEKELEIVEEPGALQQLSDFTLEWFRRHLGQSKAQRSA